MKLFFLKFHAIFFILFLISFSSQAQTIKLSPEKVRLLALERLSDIKLAEIDHEIKLQELKRTYAIYDLNLGASFNHQVNESDRNSIAFGSKTETTNYGLSLAQHTPLGTSLTFGYASQRDKAENINPLFSNFNPVYNTQISLGLTQPILKNIFGFSDRKTIDAVKKSVDASEFQKQARIDQAIYMVMIHYYQFYVSWKNHIFALEGLTRARELYETNLEKKDLGLIEASDLEAFKANYENREADLLAAKNILITYKEQLKQDLEIDQEISISDFKNSKVEKSSFEDKFNQAKKFRNDFLSLKKEEESLISNQKSSKNNLLPELNATASLSFNGLDGGHNASIGDIEGDHKIYSIGLEFSHPLQNRNQRSGYQTQTLLLKRKKIEIDAKELEIKKQVKERLEQYYNARKILTSLNLAKEYEKNKLEGERKKYNQGRSDSDIVIRYENDYILAQQKYFKAKADFEIAKLNLDLVTGRINSK